MKCPNCKAKLPAGAFIFNYYNCKSCGGVLVAKRWISIFAALMAIVVGKLIFSEYYVFAAVLTLVFCVVLFVKRSSVIEVRFETKE
jgi:uncharacterized protein (DUF983 family)